MFCGSCQGVLRILPWCSADPARATADLAKVFCGYCQGAQADPGLLLILPRCSADPAKVLNADPGLLRILGYCGPARSASGVCRGAQVDPAEVVQRILPGSYCGSCQIFLVDLANGHLRILPGCSADPAKVLQRILGYYGSYQDLPAEPARWLMRILQGGCCGSCQRAIADLAKVIQLILGYCGSYQGLIAEPARRLLWILPGASGGSCQRAPLDTDRMFQRNRYGGSCGSYKGGSPILSK